MKLRFATQSNVHDVVLNADEVNSSREVGTEVVFYSKAVIKCIMSFNNGNPLEKIVKICLEDHSTGSGHTICYGRLDLADVLNEVISEGAKTVYEDISFSQNLGLMRLSITPKKMELREKVNFALSKPPVHTPMGKMPMTPMRAPNKHSLNSEIRIYNVNSEIKLENMSQQDNWNDVSF
jgi:hypothetical protein